MMASLGSDESPALMDYDATAESVADPPEQGGAAEADDEGPCATGNDDWAPMALSPNVWESGAQGDAVLSPLTPLGSDDESVAGAPLTTTPDMSLPPLAPTDAARSLLGTTPSPAAMDGLAVAAAAAVPTGDTTDYTSSMVGKVHFELPPRYVEPVPLGSGAFGVVMKAKDMQTGGLVAIKKITNVYGKAAMAKRVYREINILRVVAGDHQNKILRMLDVYTPPTSQNNSVYIVYAPRPSPPNHPYPACLPFVLLVYHHICRTRTMRTSGY